MICSDIGGMAEKVRHGIDGFHFPVGNAMALTNLLRNLAERRDTLIDLATSMSGRPALETSFEDYIKVYRQMAVAECGT